jgi:hypothetical protein
MGSSPAFRHPPLDSNGTMRASKGKKHSPLPNPFMHSAAHDNTPTPKVASFNTHVCSPPLPLNRSKKLLFPPPSKLVPSLHDAAKSPVKKERHSTFSNQADAGFRPDHFSQCESQQTKLLEPDISLCRKRHAFPFRTQQDTRPGCTAQIETEEQPEDNPGSDSCKTQNIPLTRF